MGQITFVLGGARSGKTTFAEQRALEIGGQHVLFLATAEAGDNEMKERITRHQASRPPGWRTAEAPLSVRAALDAEYQGEAVVLLDCITLLVSNYLLHAAGSGINLPDTPEINPFDPAIESEVKEEIGLILDFFSERQAALIAVSNEVGSGIVPPYELGRAYRDLLGRANQMVATAADEVILMVAGLPMRVK